MREKLYKILPLICLIYLIIGMQNEGFTQNTRDLRKPNIEFENTYYDYGIIFEGSEEIAIFKLKNKGNSPLVISNIETSCGCIMANWPKDPILPNQKGEIEIEYNTNIIGEIKRSVLVNTNDIDKQKIVLLLTGKIEKLIN